MKEIGVLTCITSVLKGITGVFTGITGVLTSTHLGGERGGAGHAGVHLDDHQIAIGRVDGKLAVGPAALHTDLADDGNGRVAKALVLLFRVNNKQHT